MFKGIRSFIVGLEMTRQIPPKQVVGATACMTNAATNCAFKLGSPVQPIIDAPSSIMVTATTIMSSMAEYFSRKKLPTEIETDLYEVGFSGFTSLFA